MVSNGSRRRHAARTWEGVAPVLVTILAWTGALLSCLLTIPQVVRTLRSSQLEGLSATTYWLILGNAAVWAAWSALSGEYAAGVPALVNGPAALLILRRLHHSQRSVEPEYVGDPPRARNPRSIQSVGGKNAARVAGWTGHDAVRDTDRQPTRCLRGPGHRRDASAPNIEDRRPRRLGLILTDTGKDHPALHHRQMPNRARLPAVSVRMRI
jgi:uncharacterized protein with PQ loop repeat